jgi:hypothetical protein
MPHFYSKLLIKLDFGLRRSAVRPFSLWQPRIVMFSVTQYTFECGVKQQRDFLLLPYYIDSPFVCCVIYFCARLYKLHSVNPKLQSTGWHCKKPNCKNVAKNIYPYNNVMKREGEVNNMFIRCQEVVVWQKIILRLQIMWDWLFKDTYGCKIIIYCFQYLQLECELFWDAMVWTSSN